MLNNSPLSSEGAAELLAIDTISSMAVYIQIGAGAGDLDHSAGFRDGFTAFIKSRELAPTDQIHVVEANPFNISTLERCWQDFSQVRVHGMAIGSASELSCEYVNFYYAKNDAPFFQVASLKIDHVKKFYPNDPIYHFEVKFKNINTFLRDLAIGGEIELLAIDIEGLDLEVLSEIDLELFDIRKISFEKSHDVGLLDQIESKLKSFGYHKSGSGMDPHNSDVLWAKPNSFIDLAVIKYKQIVHSFWEVQIPARHLMKNKIAKSLIAKSYRKTISNRHSA